MSDISAEPKDSPGKQKAQGKIDAKLRLLDTWCQIGIPWFKDAQGHRLCDASNHPLLEFFPSTIAEFSKWTASRHCDATLQAFPQLYEFESLSRDTLNQAHNSTRKNQVTTGLARVKARAALQVEELSLSETLESLKSERDHWKALATAQESEIETFRQLAILATENLEETQALGNRVRAHAQKKIKQLETELSRLRAEATKDKVIPIFSTSKSKGKRYEK